MTCRVVRFDVAAKALEPPDPASIQAGKINANANVLDRDTLSAFVRKFDLVMAELYI